MGSNRTEEEEGLVRKEKMIEAAKRERPHISTSTYLYLLDFIKSLPIEEDDGK